MIDDLTDAMELEMRSTREFWDARIQSRGIDGSLGPATPDDQKHRAALMQLLLIPHVLRSAKRVLEIGCGPGRLFWIPEMCASSAAYYVGVDFMPEYIDVARKRFPGCRYEVADARHLPFKDGEFDLVIGVDVASSLAWKFEEEVWPEIQRVLSAEGLFILAENDYVRYKWKVGA